jgi:hypothetical protein
MSSRQAIHALPDERERRLFRGSIIDRLIVCERCGVKIFKSNKVAHKDECTVLIARNDAKEAKRQKTRQLKMKESNRKYREARKKK